MKSLLSNFNDVVVVLDSEDIVFHGIIGKFEDGEAYASDPKGSLLAAAAIQ